jgi:ribonuclease D
LPSVTTSVPVIDAPPEELRRIARQRPQLDPLEVALEEWRQQKARIGRMEPNGILTNTQMRNIVREKPRTEEAIAGLTDIIFASRYATELIATIDSVMGR